MMPMMLTGQRSEPRLLTDSLSQTEESDAVCHVHGQVCDELV